MSLFAITGELWKPKTFAGLFGAAPSVAIVSLAMASSSKGSGYVAIEARSMLVGACALFVYCSACVLLTRLQKVPIWLSAGLAWLSWFAACFALRFGLSVWGFK